MTRKRILVSRVNLAAVLGLFHTAPKYWLLANASPVAVNGANREPRCRDLATGLRRSRTALKSSGSQRIGWSKRVSEGGNIW
jgi:hypothetical protein